MSKFNDFFLLAPGFGGQQHGRPGHGQQGFQGQYGGQHGTQLNPRNTEFKYNAF